MIEIGIVPPELVERKERTLRPLVESLNRKAPGHWTWDHVRDEAQAEDLHLWFATDGTKILLLVGCRPDCAPGGARIYDVMWMAGERLRDVFHPMVDEFQKAADAMGARLRIPYARPALTKLMKERGMKIVAVCGEAR